MRLPTALSRTALALIFAVVSAGCSGKTSGGSSERLSGGGATFVEPAVQMWAEVYQEEKGTQVDYQGNGSGAGIQQMTAKTIDFGCSDAPMNREQLATAKAADGDVLHVPLVMGAVVPAYNLPGIDRPLHFTGPLLADIYLGKIQKWNDPVIAQLNPGVTLPDLDIAPVYRAESSGTTNIFTEYLSKVSPEFKEKVGASTQPKWPVGQGQRGNPGVAGYLERSPGSVGYVELFFALQNKKIRYGSVRNKAGQQVLANLEAITAAADSALRHKPTVEPYSLHDLTYSLTDPDGEKSYPICGMSYALLFKKQPAGKGQALVEFLRWSVGPGQIHSKEMGYAALPADLVKRAGEKLSEVEFVP